MAKSLDQFRQQVLQDPALAEQFKAIQSPDEFANLAVQLGQQLGYNFTADEVIMAIAQQSSSESIELSDAQLEAVAGGDDTQWCSTQNTSEIACCPTASPTCQK
uniref:Nif11 domain-containing protein n=1 Tax=Cyanothece sp. (strain PCC 7425 / ATCC 29141) TaxID=395961 RepID=B8HM24_CYAP4